LPNLTDQEKSDFGKEVDAANTLPEISTVVDTAKAKDAENLAKAKAEARDKINQLPNLTDAEKADFIKEVDAATTVAKVKEVVAAAEAQDAANLAAAKTEGKKEVNA